MSSSMGSPSEPFDFITAYEWEVPKIQEWLREVTVGCKGADGCKVADGCKDVGGCESADQRLKELWTKFLWPHFNKGESIRFNSDGKALCSMEVSLNGVSFNIYSSWCALAIVLNLKLPPYDPDRGSAQAYARTILVFLAKWSNSISSCLRPNKYSPPVYSVFFAKGDQLSPPSTSKSLVTIISTGKCSSLNPGEERTRLFSYWDAGRLAQLVELFDPNDNPLLERNSWLKEGGGGKNVGPRASADIENVGPRAPVDLENIKNSILGLKSSDSIQDSVKENTLRLYVKKMNFGEKNKLVVTQQLLGSCAETWGFMMMSKVVRRGGNFTSISVSNYIQKLKRMEILENYEVRNFKPKPACYNCVYLSCAFEAKYKIMMEEFRGERPANPPPAPAIHETSTAPPQNSQDDQIPEDTPPSSQTKRPIGEADPEICMDKVNKRHRACVVEREPRSDTGV